MRFAYLGTGVLLAALGGCLANAPTAPVAAPDVAEASSPVIEDAPDFARSLLALPPSTVPVVLPPNPGPKAARGQILVNGVPKAGIAIQIQKTTGGTITCITDANGYYTARNLAPGSYLGYFYNATDRMKIGYWRGVARPVTNLTGASFPAVDLYQVGMTNVPKMDSHVGLPTTFSWVRQVQKVDHCWFRIHDRPFTAFTLTYKSAQLPGDTSSFTFKGGVPLSKTNRYFWGFQWDAGPVGMGGNLYQAVYFDR